MPTLELTHTESDVMHFYSQRLTVRNIAKQMCRKPANVRIVLIANGAIEPKWNEFKDGRKLRNILTTENAKTSKGEKLGILTAILYLAPSNESSVLNVCTSASPGCIKVCLFSAGRGGFVPVRNARIAKTLMLVNDREYFLACLEYSIKLAIRKAKRMGLKLAVRVNGTSDLAWMALQMASIFPDVQFYDYTKHAHAWTRTRSNYHLTFSASEINASEQHEALAHGLNVAMVFSTKKKQPLPETHNGVPVIDGDLHDIRFLDGYSGSIIGLRAKGKARKDCSGFVVAPHHASSKLFTVLQ